jgi:hypothetical protein
MIIMRKALNRTPWFIIVSILIAPGCGSDLAEVSGTVKIEGTSVTSGSVIFYLNERQLVSGVIQKDGTYTIPNVPFGDMKVLVRSHPRMLPGLQNKPNLPPSVDSPHLLLPQVAPRETQAALPVKYAQANVTPLELHIDRSVVRYDLDLQK